MIERIRVLRYTLPVLFIILVVFYQLQVARPIEETYGEIIHYGVEIAFYSILAPAVTWFTLLWIEQSLKEKEALAQQVQLHSQQLASLAASSQDAIVSADHQWRVTSWNQGASNLFGYSAEEMIGQPIQILFPINPGVFENSQKDSPVQNLELTGLSRNGQSIRVDLTQSQIEQANENAPISLLIMRDVTYRSERLAIIEEERARIARDLHDGVAQTLYFLAIKAQMVDQQYHNNQEEARKTLKEMSREARRAIQDTRRAIFGLRPLDWSEKGFLSSLKDFVEDFTGQIGWKVDIYLDPNLKIPSRLEPTIFRLVQESLNNAAKHANAEKITVSIQEDESRQLIKVKIVDDGNGFDLKSVKRGLGIEQMENRVQSVNGVFRLQSQPGSGTEILAEISISGSS